MALQILGFASFIIFAYLKAVTKAEWTHHAILDAAKSFHVRWTPYDEDLAFLITAPTTGWFGFGFSPHGNMAGADMMIGWVKDGVPYIQDRYAYARAEPDLDESQDWHLVAAHENETHTMMHLRRKYNTCDDKDIVLSNDTIRLLYAFHPDDPEEDASLPYHGPPRRGSRTVYLTERVQKIWDPPPDVLTWELRSPNVLLSETEDTLYWCKIYKAPNFETKHHMIRYEPVFQSGNEAYMHHVLVFECQGGDLAFEAMAKQDGHRCYQPNMPPTFLKCNSVIIAWAVGSEGLSLPEDVGFPVGSFSGSRYYMMEVHYDNPTLNQGIRDNSGIRMYLTPNLRKYDAGVLSVGVDPNWKHVIPPGMSAVLSDGHCISDCTRLAFPADGINMFAVILHTHLLGRKIRFRHIRNGEELMPIAMDNNYDFNYQEYRILQNPTKILPGDHLIGECSYNSRSRATVTLGGLSTREEMCLVFGYYYPRMELSLCHSIPTLQTVLSAMGVDELWMASNPLKIKLPQEIANVTLEEHFLSFDWKSNFKRFQNATRYGAYQPVCWVRSKSLLPGTEEIEAYYPNITKEYEVIDDCVNIRKQKLASVKLNKKHEHRTTVLPPTFESVNSNPSKASTIHLNQCLMLSVLVTFSVKFKLNL